MSDPDGEFERFFARNAPKLVGSLTLYCGDRLLAEEFAQEALARAMERWGRVGAMTSPEAWTYRTAFNIARTSFRRAAAERRARERMSPAPDVPDTAEMVALRDAVLALPPRQRSVTIARFYLGLDVAETARMLGCRPGTVKAHTFKALANLRTAGLTDAEESIDDTSV